MRANAIPARTYRVLPNA